MKWLVFLVEEQSMKAALDELLPRLFFSFPRAGVGTHSRRASVEVKRELSFSLSLSDDEQT
jgi:hypothetical protein